MKVSICIPQYNRIRYLLKSLQHIANQNYPDMEIVISDDGSTDETETEIQKLIPSYKYPILFAKNEKNLGYDRNYRKCIELASGDYCIVLGNDDTLNEPSSIQFLVNFLIEHDEPEVGFCNFIEDNNRGVVVRRAQCTDVLGSGAPTASKYYSCFSFVGGLIYKKSSFEKYNSAKFDGSIYAQIYLGCLMVASGCRLFAIMEPLIIKDIYLDGKFRHSYRDRIAKKWRDMKVVNGGMPSVIHVVINGLSDAGISDQKYLMAVFRRVYSLTFPHWILDYKANHAIPEAVGLTLGMNPIKNPDLRLLHFYNQWIIIGRYIISIFIGFLTPVFMFKKFKNRIYVLFKK